MLEFAYHQEERLGLGDSDGRVQMEAVARSSLVLPICVCCPVCACLNSIIVPIGPNGLTYTPAVSHRIPIYFLFYKKPGILKDTRILVYPRAPPYQHVDKPYRCLRGGNSCGSTLLADCGKVTRVDRIPFIPLIIWSVPDIPPKYPGSKYTTQILLWSK